MWYGLGLLRGFTFFHTNDVPTNHVVLIINTGRVGTGGYFWGVPDLVLINLGGFINFAGKEFMAKLFR